MCTYIAHVPVHEHVQVCILCLYTLLSYSCGPPPELDNGNMTFDSTLFGSVATYECDEDYFFDDGTQTTRTCLESGEWSNENLLCSEFVSESHGVKSPR